MVTTKNSLYSIDLAGNYNFLISSTRLEVWETWSWILAQVVTM